MTQGKVVRRSQRLATAVDAYIARQPSHAQPILRRVRRIIRKALPGAQETISYQMPTYKRRGEYVVYFAGWKQHWSLYPVTARLRAAFASALAVYEVSKGTVRFPLTDPVPARLVERIVTALAKDAERRAGSKTTLPINGARSRRRTARATMSGGSSG